MPSNGTPQSWRDRAAAQPPRRIVVADRPPLDPDPLQVEAEEWWERRSRRILDKYDRSQGPGDLGTLLLAVAIVAILAGAAVLWPEVARWLRS